MPSRKVSLALHSLAVLALQQAPVRVDLTLQPGPDIQQHLVLLVLPLQVTPDLRQLGLHIGDHALHLGQLGAVAGLGLCQRVLQRVPLKQKERLTVRNRSNFHGLIQEEPERAQSLFGVGNDLSLPKSLWKLKPRKVE